MRKPRNPTEKKASVLIITSEQLCNSLSKNALEILINSIYYKSIDYSTASNTIFYNSKSLSEEAYLVI